MEQFEQLLTCCVCLDRYRNPKLLPCQHSFCMEPCMDGLVDYVRRQVKCPECRAEHRIPYQGVQGFPTNVTLQRFLELHIEITGELPDPTSGQIMERCTVCSEKSYCTMCCHCDKKTCGECKSAHMDILRREIARINNQIRRGVHRLQDTLAIVEKNSLNLQTNCLSVSEEVDEIFRRLNKALKDRTDALRMEVDRYLGTELRSLTTLKDNLELEIANIQSNCDLADKYMTENVDWEDSELMDAKEIFLKTVDFIRNFEYETGDYARRVRFTMSMDPNQLVMHVATYGELTMSPGHAGAVTGSSSGMLQAPGGPGLMRSKSDHRLASQFRQQEEGRAYGRGNYDDADQEPPLSGRKFGERPAGRPDTGRYGRGGDYGGDYDYEEANRPTRSRFRSRFVRNQDNDSDNEQSGRNVRFTEPPPKERERVLDTEDVSRGPLSGIFRLTDSPRVMKRLQESEQRGKKKDKEPPPPVQVQPKVQPPKRGTPAAAARQISEEDEISKLKRQNKGAASSTDTTTESRPAADRVAALKRGGDDSDESRHNSAPGSPTRKTPQTEAASSEEESDESVSSLQAQRKAAAAAKTPATTTTPRKLSDSHKLATRSASSDSGTSSDSSGSSTGIHTGASEVKPKTASAETPRSRPASTGSSTEKKETNTAPARAPFQSRFLNRNSTPAPAEKPKEDDDEEETETSSEEETESSEESEEEQPKKTPNTADMSRTDIGPLLARSSQARETAESRRNSRDDSTYGRGTASTYKSTYSPEESPSRFTRTRSTQEDEPISRYGRISRPSSIDEDSPSPSRYTRTRPAVVEDEPPSRYGSGYTSRFLNKSKSTATVPLDDEEKSPTDDDSRYPSGRARYMALKDRRNRLARSKSSHTFGDDDDLDEPMSPTTTSPSAYIASRYGTSLSGGSDLARSRSSHALKSRESSPERPSASAGADKDGAALSSWARYLKNKYGNRGGKDTKDSLGTSTSISPSSSSSAARRLSLGLPLRAANEHGSSDDDSKNAPGSPISPTAATAAAGIAAVVGFSPRSQYLQKRRQLFQVGSRGSEPGCFTWPRGIAVGPDNAIVVADSSNHRVQVFDASGQFMKEFGSYGNGEGEFDCLAGVAVNRIGQYIIADRYNHRIQVLDPAGRFLRAFGSQGTSDGKFNYPWGITTDALGFIYVCDKENHRVQVFQSDGTFVGKFGSCGSKPGQLEHPHYIAVSNTNRVIVSDSNNHRVQIFDVNGRVLTAFGTEGCDDGQFKFPRSVVQSYFIPPSTLKSPHIVYIVLFSYNNSGQVSYICIPHKYLHDYDFHALLERPLVNKKRRVSFGGTSVRMIESPLNGEIVVGNRAEQKIQFKYGDFFVMIVIYCVVFYCFIVFVFKY